MPKQVVRPMTPSDLPSIQRLLNTSEYIYCRFTPDELPHLVETRPGYVAATEENVQAFILAGSIVPPSAWLNGFGVIWTEGQRHEQYLDMLLPSFTKMLKQHGASNVYYSGNDLGFDWLLEPLEKLNFRMLTTLRSYDKLDFSTPTEGNQEVTVRPFTKMDVDNLLRIENACFEPYWRYDAAGFLEVARTHPYFVVAVEHGRVIGYQFNAIDVTTGYLIRIAVHPAYSGRKIGARLLADAVHYFEKQKVWKIVLNTEEKNSHAHSLYEWFGFELVHPRGFVLEKDILD